MAPRNKQKGLEMNNIKNDEIFFATLTKKPNLPGVHSVLEFQIPVKGPVHLNHEIFGKLEEILTPEGIIFHEEYAGRAPRDYHLTWHTMKCRNT